MRESRRVLSIVLSIVCFACCARVSQRVKCKCESAKLQSENSRELGEQRN